MTKSQQQSLPLPHLSVVARVSLWNISQRRGDGGRGIWCLLTESVWLLAGLSPHHQHQPAKLTAGRLHSSDSGVQCGSYTHIKQCWWEEALIVWRGKTKRNQLLTWFPRQKTLLRPGSCRVLSLLLLLRCLWELADHLLPPCDNSDSLQRSIRYLLRHVRQSLFYFGNQILMVFTTVFIRPGKNLGHVNEVCKCFLYFIKIILWIK